MPLPESIIAPWDGSALSETAIPYVAELARVTGARVTALRVFEEMRPIYDQRSGEVIWIDPDHPRAELVAPDVLQPVVERLAALGVPAEAVVRLGDPRVEIVQEAGAHPHPWIVLASHGRGGLGRLLLGSAVKRVVQTSTCPVVVVRARPAEEQPERVSLRRVTVLLDGSALAEQALAPAAALAQAAGGTLRLLRVAETYRDELPPHPEEPTGPLPLAPSQREILQQFERMEREAADYLEGVAERLRAEGVDVGWEVLSGEPRRQISAYIKLDHPDLVALTTHGHGGIASWLYGSVTDHLLSTSTSPLLVVRARGAERP
ncbi:MAG: universal stress protein [Thermomicrobiaceae bacterium]|nr:universal stress protein [Thermomicrobiaceae bacterium]